MAINAPAQLISSSEPSRGSSSTAPVRPCSPAIHFFTCLNVLISILGCFSALSYMTFEALNTSLRWMTVTLLANLVRKVASSIAESPPPTTMISSSRKKAPSHVAHVEIPRPFCSSSPSAPSQIASAPVQIISE